MLVYVRQGLRILAAGQTAKSTAFDVVTNGKVLGASGGLLALLFVGGGSYWMYRRRGETEKASIVTDDQDDWNNFSYEDNGNPKLHLDGADRQNSMEWIQLK